MIAEFLSNCLGVSQMEKRFRWISCQFWDIHMLRDDFWSYKSAAVQQGPPSMAWVCWFPSERSFQAVNKEVT